MINFEKEYLKYKNEIIDEKMKKLKARFINLDIITN